MELKITDSSSLSLLIQHLITNGSFVLPGFVSVELELVRCDMIDCGTN